MTKPRYEPGRFCWAELSTPDPDGSKAFYRELFGWSTLEPMPGVAVAQLEGKSVAAISVLTPELRGEGVPPHWLSYIAVASADAAARRAEEFGGTVVLAPGDVGPAARLAIVRDPVGAVIGLWEGRQRPGAELEGVPGAFTWHDLGTDDPEAAIAFYSGVFGYRTRTEDMGEGRTFTTFLVDDPHAPTEGGIVPTLDGLPPSWLTYFAVENCEASASKVEQLGGKVLFGPMSVRDGQVSFAMVQDPHGAAFGLMQSAHA